ncbi:MAG: adenylyl-sulfate kinase [Verrucomicrobiales bacterium]
MADDVSANLHPQFQRQLGRPAKERLVRQRGRVVWLYGLSGSGKSTLAHMIERTLHAEGHLTVLLDGDNLRTGLNSGLGFTPDDRRENVRRAAEVAHLFVESGVIAICSFICPFRNLRQLARQIIGADDFLEVYVHASFELCSVRDPKGLYKKAAEGKVAHFTGRSSVFEPPEEPMEGLKLDTQAETPEQSLEKVLAVVCPWIQLQPAPRKGR